MFVSPEAEKIFNEAITLTPEERSGYLVKACADNEILLEEVNSLLTAANESEAYFGKLSEKVGLPALGEIKDADIAGKILGQWKLVGLLGRGGMGSVYLAERADGQFEKQVALKTLPIGLDSEIARTRFVNERQILARLVHDNIARLLDGGVNEDGTPYFVMDYVEGSRIDEYCSHHDCSIEDRVNLVLEVANGVQFAHRNLIIHRDLKPTNILVEKNGRPRLLDFGIAKVLESKAGDSEVTQLAQRPVTPAYASPEMLRGEAVDVTTDVYSLGAVLYQLLTEQLPLPVEGLNLAELYEQARSRTPVPANKINQKIDSDLSAILAKALAKLPLERYESIASFAQDLSNWRNNLPVAAKPMSAFYTARKFIRRNTVGVILTSVAALSLTSFAVFANYSAKRSQQQIIEIAAERDRAEATREFLVSIFDAAGPKAGGENITAMQLLEQGRLRLREEMADKPRLHADMLQTIGFVYATMGLNSEWRTMLLEKKELVEKLDGKNSQSYFDTVLQLAQAVDMLGDYDAAENLALELVEISKTLDDDANAAQAHGRLGRAMHLKGDYDGAGKEYDRALTLFLRSEGHDSMLTADAKLNVAALLNHQEQYAEAYEIMMDVEATHKRIKKDDFIIETDLYLTIGRILGNLGRYDEAIETYQKTIDSNIKLYGPDYTYNLYLASGMSYAYEAQGQYNKAVLQIDEVLRLVNMHIPESPNLGRALLSKGRIFTASGNCDVALPYLQEALKNLNDRIPEHSVIGEAKWRLGFCHAQLGNVEMAQELILDGYRVLSSKLAADNKSVVEAREAVAQFYTSQGKPDEAGKYH